MRYWLIAAVLLCLCQTGQAQSHAYELSVGAVVGANIIDGHSSWNRYELNPVLGRGQFGARQIGIKLAIVGGWQVAQWLIVRRWPETRRAATIVNYGAAVGTGAVAWRNYQSTTDRLKAGGL